MTGGTQAVKNLNPAPADMRRALEGLGLAAQAPGGQPALAPGVRPQLPGTLGPQQQTPPPAGQVNNPQTGQQTGVQQAAQSSPAGPGQQPNALLSSPAQLGITSPVSGTSGLKTPPTSQITHQQLLSGIANSLANSASNTNPTPDGMTAMTMTKTVKDWHQSVTQDLRNHLVHKL